MSKTEFQIEPAKQEVIIRRVFDAPRELVFKAFTDPKLITQWLGPRSLTMTVDKMDVRPGGLWRYIHRDPSGSEHGFHGVCHDVVAPERIVRTFEYEGVPGHVSLETATFESLGGKTRMAVQSVFQSVKDRDGMVQSGMQEGASESYDRLAELLTKLLAKA